MWTQITTDFDPEEETKNFGTRHAIEAAGKIFDVFTHATIAPKLEDNQVIEEPPWLISCSRKNPDKLALVLDNYLHVFSHDLQDVFSIDLKTRITSLKWLVANDSFLMCGLDSGRFQLVHVKSGRPLPSIQVTEDQEAIVGITDDFQFICQKGKVYQLEAGNLDFEVLNEALQNSDFPKLQEFQASLKIHFINDFNENVKYIHQDLICMPSAIGLHSQNLQDILDFDHEIVKILKPKNNELVIVLDVQGAIHVICKQTMLKIKTFKPDTVLPIVDMVLLEDGSNLKLITVTKETLKIVTFPQFEVLYELKLCSEYCQLLDTCFNQDTPLFIEGSISGQDENQDTSNTLDLSRMLLRLRAICEGNPEERLCRLLERQKFDEAEKFANFNNLSGENVHISKARSLVNKLASMENNQELELFNSLQETLSKIKNDEKFIIDCCLTAMFKDLRLTRKMLMLGRKCLSADVTKVNEALHRLDTFIFVFGHQQGLESWMNFCNADMFEELIEHLNGDKINQALIIWNRHKSEMDFDLQCILNSLPKSTESKLSFLRTFIPDCLLLAKDQNDLAVVLESLAKWTLLSTSNLETDSGWPQTGIDFAQEILDILNKHHSTDQDNLGLATARIPLMIAALKNKPESHLNKIIRFIATLKDLKQLHDTFNIRVKLSDFDDDDKTSVSHLLLDWCTSAKEMKRLINDFLLALLVKFGVDKDQVFASYIQILVKENDCCWYKNPDECAPWQDRVLCLMDFLGSSSLRVDMILVILKHAPAPWSLEIRKLAQFGKDLNEAKSFMIGEYENLVVVKQIVVKYQAGNHYRRRGPEAQRLIQRMFQRKLDEETLQDAISVAKVLEGVDETDAKFIFVDQLVEKDRHKEAVRALDDENVLDITERMVIKAELAEESTGNLVLFLKAVLIQFAHLPEDVQWRIQRVANEHLLKTKFNLKMSELKDVTVSLAVAKLFKISKLMDDENCLKSLLDEYSEMLDDPQDLKTLAELLVDYKFPAQTLKAFKYDASVNSVAVNDCEDLEERITHSKWCQWINEMKRQTYDKTMFEDVQDDLGLEKKLQANCFKDKGLPLDQEILQEAIDLYESFAHVKFSEEQGDNEDDITAPITKTNLVQATSLEDIQQIMEKLQSLFGELSSKNQYFLAYRMVKLVNWPLIMYESNVEDKCNLFDHGFFSKCFVESKPDLPFLLAIVNGQAKSKKDGLMLLQQSITNMRSNSKLINLSRIGLRYCSRLALHNEKSQFVNLLQSASWGQKLNLETLALANINGDQVMDVIGKYISDKEVIDHETIEDLKLFAKAYSLSLSSVGMTFVRKFLSRQSIDNFEIVTQVLEWIPNDNDKEELLQTMLDNEVSPYNYQVLGFILGQLQDQDCPMLQFLMTYERSASPTDDEVDSWIKKDTGPFPTDLAKKRLPFHPLFDPKNSPKDMFNLLSREFTIETYQKWLQVAKTFKLSPTNVRTMAAKNTITNLLSDIEIDPNHWYDKPLISEDVLASIFNCLEEIPDFVKANSMAYWIANRLPKGREKLLVTCFWFNFVQSWNQHNPSDETSSTALNLAYKAMLKLEVENVLYQNGIVGKANYLSLIDQGLFESLIQDLYEHEFKDKNVNKAASEIGCIINNKTVVNLTLIKYKLLDKWLPESKSNQATSLDETMTNFNLLKSLKNNDATGADNDEDNYWRCVHILQGFADGSEESEACDYLLQVTFSTDTKWTTNHKLRALKCLLTVIDGTLLEAGLGKSCQDLETRFQSLILVSQLERLDLPYHSVEAVQETDKMSLIQSIFRNCGHLPQGIALVVDLCLQHQIFKLAFWSKLLSRLLTMGDNAILKNTLLSMNKAPSLWHCPEFHQGWTKLTFEPFVKASDPPSQTCIEECRRSVQLIQSCPIASEIGIQRLIEECQKLGLNDLTSMLEPIAFNLNIFTE